MSKPNNQHSKKQEADTPSCKKQRPPKQAPKGSSQSFYNNIKNQGNAMTDCGMFTTTKKLNTIGAQELMECILPSVSWLVDGLLVSGTVAIIAARPKLGKSWLCLQLAHALATGQQFLNRSVTHSGALYLCLEDNYNRLQERLWMIDDESSNEFQLVTTANTLNEGLLEQIGDHLTTHPDTKLVVIDTLQVVRDAAGDYSYSSDYHDLRRFKQFADERDICILLVHHLRKTEDANDDFADISGTTGISGAADTMLVIKQEHRGKRQCTLSAIGRDVEYKEIIIELCDKGWKFIKEREEKDLVDKLVPEPILLIAQHFESLKQSWQGNATDLIEYLGLGDVKASVLGKYLSQHREYLAEHDIDYSFTRTKHERIVTLEYIGE